MRICTWNIQLGLRLEAVLAAVRDQPDFRGVDLLAVQEASSHAGRSDADAIAEALGPEYTWFQATAQRRRRADQANALIWRRDSLSLKSEPTVVQLPGRGEVHVTRAERALLWMSPPQARMAICVEFEGVRVYVMHLDVIGFKHKLEQFKAITKHMAKRAPVPLTVIAGDLNTFGPARVQLWRRLSAAAREAGLTNLTAGVRRTHRTGQKLDAIYALVAGASEHHAWTLKVRASDHLPVFADLEVKLA